MRHRQRSVSRREHQRGSSNSDIRLRHVLSTRLADRGSR
jgi:hypothetical protein